jgi:hypothetical protein
MLPIQDAISAVEEAFNTLSNDQAAQGTAGAAVDQAQAKLDSAKSVKASADTTVARDVSTVNGALDDLIAAATAAKIPVPDPSTPAPGQALTVAA